MFYSDDPARDWDRYCDYMDAQHRAWLEEVNGSYVSATHGFDIEFIPNKENSNVYDAIVYGKKYLEVKKEELNHSLEEYAFLTYNNQPITVDLKGVYFSFKVAVVSDDEMYADEIDEMYSENEIILNKQYSLPDYDIDATIGLALFEKICMKVLENYILSDYDGIYDDVQARF